MASGPISSWQVDGETMETVTDFSFLGPKITAYGDCSHEIKWENTYEQPRLHIKKQRLLCQQFYLVKGMIFPVVMYGCESWTMKKAECQRIDAFFKFYF